MPCPDPNSFAAFMAGVVTDAERQRIEAHVDGCALCADSLAVAARADAGSELPFGAVGRYQLVRALGMGGMGVVYEALDPTLERALAVKLLRPELPEEAGARLVVEAKALGQLAHPNVVRVLDAGVHEGHYFVAMERVAGEPLRAWLQRAPRTVAAVLDVFLALGDGLAAVHRAGLVHRDIKPDNVLVGEDGVPTLIDFGLALSGTRVRAMGEAREVAGTFAYMAPEQRRGEHVGPAADQYAFCLVLFEALHGSRTTVGAGRQGRPNPAAGAVAVTDKAPAWLQPLLERGLSESPASRWPSMSELVDRIRAEREGTEAGQRRLNGVFQLLMWPFHVAVNLLMLAALSAPEPTTPAPPASATADVLSSILATWLVGAFLIGWAPLGLLWTPINAFGLLRAKGWAYRSTVIYCLFAIPSVLGTPFAVYGLATLWGRAFPRRT